MKLGIMQPYFFPYLGYFELIHQVEQWIVFDTAQYSRHSWMNRNRILHPVSGWQYIVVPIKKHARNTRICAIKISDNMHWKTRILGQVQHYKKHAPYFNDTVQLLQDCLAIDQTSLSRFNTLILEKICTALDIPFHFSYFSEMDLQLGPIEGPGDWALRISEALGATEYINPPGGADLFDPEKFKAAGIKLTIQPLNEFTYPCGNYQFIPSLSIIDAMMWNSIESIQKGMN